MRFAVLLSLLVSYLALVLARPQKISRRQGSVGQDCGNGTSTLQLTQFQFQPYPLQPGANTTLTIAGTLSKPIEQGATALVSVTAGQGPPLFNNTIDLCQLAAQAGSACPIAAGDKNLNYTREVPAVLSAATFQVSINATNADGTPIFCYSGPVQIQ